MLVQHGQPHFLNRAAVLRRGASVIDHPIVRAFIGDVRVAEKNHDVIRKLLNVRLVEEQEIAGPRLFAIAADEGGVEKFECLRVGKLGKPVRRDVVRVIRARRGAKEFFAKRFRTDLYGNISSDGLIVFAHALIPITVVRAKRFAPGEADESGAVALFGVPFVTEFVKLHFRDPREPAAEVLAVVETAEF